MTERKTNNGGGNENGGCYTTNGYQFLFRDRTGRQLDDHQDGITMATGKQRIDSEETAKQVIERAKRRFRSQPRDEKNPPRTIHY